MNTTVRIALCGPSGAGKTTIAQYLARQHDFVICSTGRRCRDLALEFFRIDSKAVLNHITDAFRALQPDVWLRHALKDIPPTAPRLVIDSLRFLPDAEYAAANGFQIWRVECPFQVRLARLSARHQDYDPVLDEIHPSEHTLDGLPVQRLIDNTGSPPHRLWPLLEDHIRRQAASPHAIPSLESH